MGWALDSAYTRTLVDLHLIMTMIMIIVREWYLIIRGGIVVDVGAFTDMIYREP